MRREQHRLLPVVVAGLTALMALMALVLPLPPVASTPSEHHVQLDARMFAFTPSRVRVEKGDLVTINLVSEDVVHGVFVDGYDVNIQAEPGKPAQASFLAERPGKFRFRCSVSCGTMHPFMIGELVVGPNIPFWRAAAALLVVAIGSVVALRLQQTTGLKPGT